MKSNFKSAFTVIEVLVWVTILAIIMISVMSIYISSTDISLKTDINRAMQENIKNAVETIAEDVRKNGSNGIKVHLADTVCTSPSVNRHISWSNLCIWWTMKYTLWKLNESTGVYDIVDNSQCDELQEWGCSVLQNGAPIINSWVDVKKLEFRVSTTEVSKVTVLMEVQPSIKKWVKPDLVNNSKIHFQTTISQRPDLN